MEESAGVPGKRTTRIVRNTVVRGTAQTASVVASFVLLPFLVRAFSLADYGVFMLASTITGYAALLDLGVGATLVRMVAERLARNERERVGEVVASAASFYALIGVLAALVMLGIGLLGSAVFALEPSEAQLLLELLAIGAVVQLVFWPASAVAHALAGFERYDVLSSASLVQTVCSVLAIVAVLVLGMGPVALALINAGITIFISAAYAVFFARIAGRRIGGLVPRLATVFDVIRNGLPLFSIQLSAFLGRQSTDKLVLGIFLGPEAVAIYEIASKLSLLVSQATDLLTGAILPVAANMNAREHVESLRALFIRGARYCVVAIAPIVVVLACIARPFIRNWFGPGMAAATPVAQVLLLSQLFVPLYLVGDPILIGMNRFARWAGWGFSLAVLNVVLSVILVKRFGLIGVAVGTAIATLVELPLYARLVVREIGVDWRKWIREASVPGYVMLPIPVAIALAGAATQLGANMLTLFIVSAAAVGAYWALAWRLVLPAWERAELVTAVRSMVGKRRTDADSASAGT